MKFLFIGDLHFKKNPEDLNELEQLYLFIKENYKDNQKQINKDSKNLSEKEINKNSKKSVEKQIKNLSEKQINKTPQNSSEKEIQNIDFIVLLGDILHTHDKIDMFCQIRAIKFIKFLSKIFSQVYVLIGNHDRPNNKVFCEKNIHPFFNLKGYKKNITIVDQPLIENGCAFFPYVEDTRFYEASELIDLKNRNDIKIVFAHQNFKGANFGPIFSSCEESFSFKNKFCISGHIHLEQYVNDNLFYSGERNLYLYSSNNNKDFKITNIFKPKITVKKSITNIDKCGSLENNKCNDDLIIDQKEIEKIDFYNILKKNILNKNKSYLTKYLENIIKNDN